MPFDGVNPSIRVYDYDVKRRKIVNYKQHYLPLSEVYDDKIKGDLDAQNMKVVSKASKSKSPNDGGRPAQSAVEGHEGELLKTKIDRRNRNSKLMKFQPLSRNKREELNPLTATPKILQTSKVTAPKYLKVKGHEKCLEENRKGNSSFTTVCLPSIRPPKCDKKSWKQLNNQRAALENCTTSVVKEKEQNVSKGSETGENFQHQHQVDEDSNSGTTTVLPMEGNPIEIENNFESDDSANRDEEDDVPANEDDDTFLVNKWKFGYDAGHDLNVSEMTPEQMHSVYTDMRHDLDGTKFESFTRDLVVLRDNWVCNQTCKVGIICSMVHMFRKDVADCFQEFGEHIPPSYLAEEVSSTVSTTVVTPTQHSYKNDDVQSQEAVNLEGPPNMSSGETLLKKPVEIPADHTDGDASKAGNKSIIAVIVLLVLVAIIIGSIILYRRRHRWRRHPQSDEFLLTDSVFKYDGYSQVDQP